MRGLALAVLAVAFVVPVTVRAQPSPIAIAVLTQPTSTGDAIRTGAKMRVEEANRAGGVAGRKIDLIQWDAGTAPDQALAAVKYQAEKKKVELVIGGLTSLQALVVSKISQELKFVYIETLAMADRLMAKDQLHPYVFRVAGNSTSEGQAAAVFVVRQKVGKRVASVALDSPFGKEVTGAFVANLRRLTPAAEIVDQKSVASAAKDFAPVAAALQAARADLLFVAISADQFATFARDAKPLFGALGNKVVAVNYLGAPDFVTGLGASFPFGIWADTPDQPDWDNGCTGSECSDTRQPHTAYVQRLRAYTSGRGYQPLAIQGYVGIEILLAAVRGAGPANADAVAKALLGLSVVTSLGPMTIRADDHEANRGYFFGRVIQDPDRKYMGVEKGALYVRP